MAVVAVVIGFLGFFLARFLRAHADAKGTAQALAGRVGERRCAAVWLIALSLVLLLFVYSLAGSS